MALYAFEIPAILYFGLGFLAAVPLMLIAFSFDWIARVPHRSNQRDVIRLAQVTAEMNRILGNRDRLHTEHALVRQRFEASLRDSRAAAANEISALREQLDARDAMLERLRIRLKGKSGAARKRLSNRTRTGGASAQSARLQAKATQGFRSSSAGT